MMIKSFRHKGLERFFETGSTAGIQAKHASKLRIQLAALNYVTHVQQLDMSGWRLHQLHGKNPKGQDVERHYAISVNGNWRLTFKFEGEDVILLDYQDYH